MTEPINLFILDDHAEVRRALVMRLSSEHGVLVVGETGDAETALLQIRALKPDVVLAEIKRADGRGFELLHLIAHDDPDVPVLVLTSYPSEWEKWTALKSGAAGYLMKDIHSPELLRQIRRVAAKSAPEQEPPLRRAA